MRKRYYLIGALTVTFAVGMTAVATGARTVVQKVEGDICKPANGPCTRANAKLPIKKFKPVKVHVLLAARDSVDPESCSASPQPAGACRVPPASDLVHVDFDNDIRFFPKSRGVGRCSPASVSGVPTATARGNCPKGLVGTGTAFARFGAVGTPGTGDVPATLSAFNSTALGRVIFLVDPGFVPFTLTGTLHKSPQRGDYGRRLSTPVVAPNVLVRFDIKIKKFGYVRARCRDRNRKFNFHVLFRYGDQGVAPDNYPATTDRFDVDRCKKIKRKRKRR